VTTSHPQPDHHPEVEVPTIPAATVVPLRDGPDGVETLMLRRSSRLAFAGGMWVWPGGRVDELDHVPERPDDLEAAARRAAVREAREESGLLLDERELIWFAHWTPPPVRMRRFATWFFATRCPDSDVAVDGGEIEEHRWITPAEALARRNALEIELAPPTWITLEQLRPFRTVSEALQALSSRPAEHFATRFARVDGGAVALYHGDAGYETSDATAPGPRHRLWMLDSGWRYERDTDSSAP
jgi:8-oxo-dGTP pyrophosphatase MutT (NUDIX family)